MTRVENYRLQSVFHFVVSASDFERSLDFYQTLGFQLLRDNRDVVWPQFVADNFGMKRAQGRGSLLGIGPEEHQVRIDLIEWLELGVNIVRDIGWTRIPCCKHALVKLMVMSNLYA